MIGPSSVTGNVTNREVEESTAGVKRKAFDDLDIDDFCNEVYHDEKKQYFSELSVPIEDFSSQIMQSSGFSPMSAQEAVDIGSMTRLEVLVVDGIWDNGDLEHTHLTDLSGTCLTQETQENPEQASEEMSVVEADFGIVPTFWHTHSEAQINKTKTASKPDQGGINNAPLSTPAEDQENGNLSWLLDFKLDSFIEAPDEKSNVPAPKSTRSKVSSRNSTSLYVHEVRKSQNFDNARLTNRYDYSTSQCKSSENQNNLSSRFNGQKKPPFTYTELIEHALQEKGELTVSAIYQWISEHFPYYKSNDDRWKNSVRHNLSINPHFRKGSKAPHGAGHLWAIANKDECKSRQILCNNNITSMTRQILKNISKDCSNQRQKETIQSQVITMDEVAAATASICQPSEEEHEAEEVNEIVHSVTLEHSAEQILNGVKKEVEVQYLVPMIASKNSETNPEESEQNVNSEHCSAKETDFLNPVSKEIVAEECGLIGEGYLVTDLNPAVLGLNMTESEIVSPENLFGEELSFQFYEFTSPSQLQSA